VYRSLEEIRRFFPAPFSKHFHFDREIQQNTEILLTVVIYRIWIYMTDTPGSQRQLFSFEHDASRLELLIRIIYWILIGIVAAVYGIIASICLFIQWFHILILGRRNEGLSNFAKGYLEYMVHVMSYTYIMTDRRPDILPVTVKIFEE
jgi:hypothetical protein